MELLLGIAGLWTIMGIAAGRLAESAEYHRCETDGYRLDLCSKEY